MWDIKHRPKLFSEVRGQAGAIAVLKARLRNGTAMDTSYIFAGGSGTGKTTLARIFARAMICPQRDPDTQEPCNQCDNCIAILNDASLIFTEKDAASQGTIDHVRKIVEDLAFSTFGGEKRIYLLDEAHAISRASQDLLLKSIEEKKLVAFFCTTEPEKIRGAIRTRCEEHYIRKSSREDLFSMAISILAEESVSPVEDDAVYAIVDTSAGGARDTLNKLEMVSQLGEGVTVAQVASALNLSTVKSYYQVLDLLTTDLGSALNLLSEIEQRVSADEACAGLAEAAMNSFRIHNGILGEFTYVERGLAKTLSEKYGDYLIQIASKLSQARYVTYTTLMADLVLVARRSTTPAPRVQEVVSEAPAVKQEPRAPEVAPEAPPLTSKPSIAPSTPKQVLPKPGDTHVVRPTTTEGLRVDGVGNLGSSDPQALTAFDIFVVPDGPTGRRDKSKAPSALSITPLPGREILTPEVWRAQFESIIQSLRGNS